MEDHKHDSCFSNEDKHKLFTTIGYIKKGVDDNTEAIRKQDGSVRDLGKRVDKHDVFIGKIGAITAAMAFFASIVFTAIINWAIRVWQN